MTARIPNYSSPLGTARSFLKKFAAPWPPMKSTSSAQTSIPAQMVSSVTSSRSAQWTASQSHQSVTVRESCKHSVPSTLTPIPLLSISPSNTSKPKPTCCAPTPMKAASPSPPESTSPMKSAPPARPSASKHWTALAYSTTSFSALTASALPPCTPVSARKKAPLWTPFTSPGPMD